MSFEFVDGGFDEHAQTAFEIAGVQESFKLAHGAEELLFLARGKKQGRVRQQHAGASGLEAQSAFEVSLGDKHWISSFHATVISGGDAYALSYYECVHERIEYGTRSRDKNNCQLSLQACPTPSVGHGSPRTFSVPGFAEKSHDLRAQPGMSGILVDAPMPEAVRRQGRQTQGRMDPDQTERPRKLLDQFEGQGDDAVGCRDHEWGREKTRDLVAPGGMNSGFFHALLDLDIRAGRVGDEQMACVAVFGDGRGRVAGEWVVAAKQATQDWSNSRC